MGDYHRSRWMALSELAGDNIVFAADLGSSDSLYKWSNTSNNQNYILFSEKSLSSFDLFTRINRFAESIRINKIKTVCIPGYGRIEYLFFIAIAKCLKCKIILFAESWYGNNRILNWLKGKFLNSNCDGFLVSGERASIHFNSKLKVPVEKIRKCYSVVDNNYFKQKIKRKSPIPTLLCIARFSEEKNLKTLLKCFNNSKISTFFQLKLVGGGPQKEELLKIADGNQKILFEDWITYKDLPKVYQEAHVFILPSLFEPWGLVVNEAMASGLPIVISNQCGCLPDLLRFGNGFNFNGDNENELVAILDKISEIPLQKLELMGRVSSEIIDDFSPEIWAQNLITLIEHDSRH